MAVPTKRSTASRRSRLAEGSGDQNRRSLRSLGANGSRGTVYRHLRGMSPRGQVTLQDLGNGITESALYDDSTGMTLELSATGLRETPPANCPTVAMRGHLALSSEAS